MWFTFLNLGVVKTPLTVDQIQTMLLRITMQLCVLFLCWTSGLVVRVSDWYSEGLGFESLLQIRFLSLFHSPSGKIVLLTL